ncbi:MAG: DUF896 domain-containing protein [Pirellulaceae bacterium]|nr:DUF896 domain-containing protein [Pirellulaceae bacterium]
MSRRILCHRRSPPRFLPHFFYLYDFIFLYCFGVFTMWSMTNKIRTADIFKKYLRRQSFSGGRLPLACLTLLASLVMLVGCSKYETITTDYGITEEKGKTPTQSINGLSVFRQMLDSRGHDTNEARYFTNSLFKKQVLIWAPQHGPPDASEISLLQEWLQSTVHVAKGKPAKRRTLVVLGHHYDAAVDYWQKGIDNLEKTAKERPLTDEEKEQKKELRRQLAVEKVDAFKNDLHVITPRVTDYDANWNPILEEGKLKLDRKVTTLTGPLATNVDPKETKLHFHKTATLETFFKNAINVYGEGDSEPSLDFSINHYHIFPDSSLNDSKEFGHFLEPETPVAEEPQYIPRNNSQELLSTVKTTALLDSEAGPLAIEGRHDRWNENRLILLDDGRYLLNYGLIRPQHQKLASNLIDHLEKSSVSKEPLKITFLTTGDIGLETLLQQQDNDASHGWEALTAWPLGPILLHFAIAGSFFCLLHFYVFGRPRELPPPTTADFGKHLDAVGTLLEKTGDVEHARRLVERYQNELKK